MITNKSLQTTGLRRLINKIDEFAKTMLPERQRQQGFSSHLTVESASKDGIPHDMIMIATYLPQRIEQKGMIIRFAKLGILSINTDGFSPCLYYGIYFEDNTKEQYRENPVFRIDEMELYLDRFARSVVYYLKTGIFVQPSQKDLWDGTEFKFKINEKGE